MEPRRSNPAHPKPAAAVSAFGADSGRGGMIKRVLIILVIATVLVAAVYFTLKLVTGGTNKNVKKNQYQALFLTNGQVYFGHLKKADNSYVVLNDIYYLQVQQQVQPTAQSKDSAQPNVSLAKLGGELHGPEDTMYVSRDQVLFWENLKTDGKVAQAIKDYQASGKK